jgi:hypothetical protein
MGLFSCQFLGISIYVVSTISTQGESLTLLVMMRDVSEGKHGGNVGDVWYGVVLIGCGRLQQIPDVGGRKVGGLEVAQVVVATV